MNANTSGPAKEALQVPAQPVSAGRLPQLEFLRGVLAIVVLLHHLSLAFLPGLQSERVLVASAPSVAWTPAYLALNGPAAVVVFYVLTGFVLGVRSFAGDRVSLARQAVKRWPRLAVPAVASVLVSYYLFVTGGYHFATAGPAAGSWHLATFFDHNVAAVDGAPFEPHLGRALFEGLVGTFVSGSFSYNTPLWTMRFELAGGLLAIVLVRLLLARRPLVALGVVAIAFSVHPGLVPFCLGVGLAWLSGTGRLQLRPPFAAIAAGLGMMLLGLGEGGGAPWRLGPLDGWSVYPLGAVLLVTAMACATSLPGFLTGRVARLLGEVSFPLYLLNVPVIGSVGSVAFLVAREAGGTTATASAFAIVASVAGCVPFVFLLSRLDRWWVAVVNHAVGRAPGWGRRRGTAERPVAPGVSTRKVA